MEEQGGREGGKTHGVLCVFFSRKEIGVWELARRGAIGRLPLISPSEYKNEHSSRAGSRAEEAKEEEEQR